MTALVAGLLGLAVGLAAALAFRVSEREQRAVTTAPSDGLEEGAAAVLAVLRSAAVVATRDGAVVRASAAAHAFGLVRSDRVEHDDVRTLLDAVARDGEIRDAELELPRGPLGSGTVLLQLRVAPLGIRHVLVLAEDRTEARRVEAIRRDFVVNVSHELKTPVGALALLAETVEQAAEDPEAVRRFAGRIQTESTRLSHLVQEIIELSRLQVEDPLGQARAVPLDDVVDEAVDRARTGAAAKEIVLESGGDRGALVWGDHDLLVTAVRNLLDNAIAYSDPGTRIAVGTTVRRDDGLVEVAVVDQGIGIPADLQERLFERFYRVDEARSRDTGGTGLGLSIVKHVAADHGGEVTVWSEPGQGSTFTIRLPLASAGVPEEGEGA
ncbi:two-component sensor histidine kinase [Actinotalea ferrariae]|uniref:sensor histidine kinase n=1 Tax=Actinotalea ferrariae TaxID=1386098 RepID=UPI001C8C98D1|nr:ATP-binding protein [Actinotalea ferrariae]MBX9244851.1 two-component sensor histidine kinase [Actinotalea ferrariae]